eukprot:Gregarina_sp_Poly_1__260@NODE_1062_length_5200_cov_929_930645_g738_i0_p2_GENE_NODE_1062_length_5200_cov_929_930645_g738_i0NODE_1062_length_5200_cov_929_930645_g738_i0_p2_ORF_typecomplete_len577_score97_22DUF3667/PF12412_8/0_055_NODE_1062_length_5200_cov_929_930645_g738_i0391769
MAATSALQMLPGVEGFASLTKPGGVARSYVKGRRVTPRRSSSSGGNRHRSIIEKFSHVFEAPAVTSAPAIKSPSLTEHKPSALPHTMQHKQRRHANRRAHTLKPQNTFGQSPLKDGCSPRFPIPSLNTGPTSSAQENSLHLSKHTSSAVSGKASGSPRTSPSHGSFVLTPSTTTTSNNQLKRNKVAPEAALGAAVSVDECVAHLVRPVPKQTTHIQSETLARNDLPSGPAAMQPPERLHLNCAPKSQIFQPQLQSRMHPASVNDRIRSIPANHVRKEDNLMRAISAAPTTISRSGGASPVSVSPPDRPLMPTPKSVLASSPPENEQAVHLAASPLAAVYYSASGVPPPPSPGDGDVWRHSSSMPASLNAPSLPATMSPRLPKISGTWMQSAPTPLNSTETPSRTFLESRRMTVTTQVPSYVISRQVSGVSPNNRVLYPSPSALASPPPLANPYEPLEQAIPVLIHHVSSPMDVVYEAQQAPFPERRLHAASPSLPRADDEISLRDLVLRFQPPLDRTQDPGYEDLPNVPKIVGKGKKPIKIPKNLELDSFSGYIVPSENARYGMKPRRNNPFCVHC